MQQPDLNIQLKGDKRLNRDGCLGTSNFEDRADCATEELSDRGRLGLGNCNRAER